MTPRERADNLFNRVMQNVSSGDSTQAKFFLPMALSAYEAVPGLDAVLIGPHDLSCSLGIPEQYTHPRFDEAVQINAECRMPNAEC